MVEGFLNLVGRLAVPGAHVVHGRVGEHHAPAKGVVRAVALNHRDVMRRIALLHQQAKVQASRPSTNTDNFHHHSRNVSDLYISILK